MSESDKEIIGIDSSRFKLIGTINFTNVITAVSKGFLIMIIVTLIDNIVVKAVLGYTILGGFWQYITPIIEPLEGYAKFEVVIWIIVISVVTCVSTYYILDNSPGVRVLICNIRTRTIDDEIDIPITHHRGGVSYCGTRKINYQGLGTSFMTHKRDGSRCVVASSYEILDKEIRIQLTPLYGFSDLEILAVEQALDRFQENYNLAKVETVFWRKNFSTEVIKTHIEDMSATKKELNPYFDYKIPSLKTIEENIKKGDMSGREQRTNGRKNDSVNDVSDSNKSD